MGTAPICGSRPSSPDRPGSSPRGDASRLHAVPHAVSLGPRRGIEWGSPRTEAPTAARLGSPLCSTHWALPRGPSRVVRQAPSEGPPGTVEVTSTPEGEEDTIATRVFVGNLSYDTSQSELETLFSQAGSVVEVFLPTDRATGRPRGIAFIELSSDEEVQAAIEKFDGHELGGRTLRVNEARERAPRAPRFTESGPPEGAFGGRKQGRPKGSRRNARAKKRSL